MRKKREEAKMTFEQYSYDIFLSFRGKDTRHTFTDFLCKALRDKGLNTFIDDDGLVRGEGISDGLFKAIEESKLSIVIFSENYASSKWCLEELVKILECKREKNQMVWPIFYIVDPSDIGYQRNSYEKAMAKHAERYPEEKVAEWKSALKVAADLSGWTFKTGYEYDLFTKIIEKASTELHHKQLYIEEHVIELESCLEKVKSLLDIQHDDAVRMMGIHGIGGIGKTTLAKVLYNKIVNQFDCSYFLESVREKSNGGRDVINLQEKLLSQISEEKKFNYGSVDEGAYKIKHRLSDKKVLLVLDDVDKMVQLEKLAGGCDWFGPGSRIIVTTRHKHLLTAHGIEGYKMEELDYDNALELFCWKAFKRNKPDESYMDISNRIIDYCKGLPLALKVMGSNLFGRSLKAWESALDKYERSPDKDIQAILRVSYDDLDDDQKNIFLDIACFFRGEILEDVEKILDACDLSAHYNIEELVDKSLISVNEFDELEMHDLIQDMGKEVVKQDAMSKLGEYSRLWNHEDIVDVLTTNSGSDSIQGIMFDPPEQENVEWHGTSFEKMNNLRILIVRNANFSMAPISLPNNLRILEWDGYPSESLPQGFYPKKLVVLKLRNSRIISLNSLQNFEKLTCIDLSNCQLLIQIPDLSGTPNITSLRLEGCTSLKEVHDSVGVQTKLEILKLDGCTNLEIFPRGIKMTSLYILSLQGCRSLRHFPNILEEMVNLWYINVQGSGIKEIPHSICYLPELVVLNVSHCYDLVSLPESINQLDRLGSLNVCYCKKLCQFPRAPPNLQELRVDGCGSLTSQSLNSIFSQALQAVKPFEVHMSRIHIPNWFEHRCKGGRLSFWASEKDVRKFTFAAVLKKLTSKISSQWNESGHIQILHYNNGIPTSNCGVHDFSNESGTILLQFVDYSNINIHDWNHVEIECRSIEYSSMSPDYEIDECGVYICKEDINMEDIRFECPIPSNSNMDTVMSKNDEEPRDMIEEAKPRKRSRRFMSSNDEKVDEEKPRKMGRRVGSSNGKQREASELARRRFIKKRIGSQEQEWSIPSLLCCSALLGLLLLGIMLMEKKVKEDA